MPPSLTPFQAVVAWVAVAIAVGLAVRWRARASADGAADDAETAALLRRLRRRADVAGVGATAAVTYRSGLARPTQAGVTEAVADASGLVPLATAAVTAPARQFAGQSRAPVRIRFPRGDDRLR